MAETTNKTSLTIIITPITLMSSRKSSRQRTPSKASLLNIIATSDSNKKTTRSKTPAKKKSSTRETRTKSRAETRGDYFPETGGEQLAIDLLSKRVKVFVALDDQYYFGNVTNSVLDQEGKYEVTYDDGQIHQELPADIVSVSVSVPQQKSKPPRSRTPSKAKAKAKTKTTKKQSTNTVDDDDTLGTTPANNQMALQFVAGLPLGAFCVLFLLQQVPQLTSNGSTAGITGIVTMAGVVLGIYKTMKYLKYNTTLLAVFLATCTFTAAIDLGISGFLLGWWNLGSFYPEHGEKYFASAFGVACLAWDGVFHLLLQAFLCYQVLTQQELSKQAALVWSGSIINSMMPLLLGTAATGKFSSGVELSTAMNAPYILIPIVITYNLMTKSASTTSQAKAKAKACKPLMTPHAVFLAASHAALIALHVVRTMAVLNSEAAVAQQWLQMEPALQQQEGTNVALIQCLQSFFYLIPYHCLSLWEIFSRAHYKKPSVFTGIGDWSSLVLGAYMQATFVAWFMTIATYLGPGNIVYTSFSSSTTWIALFVIVVVNCQAHPFQN